MRNTPRSRKQQPPSSPTTEELTPDEAVQAVLDLDIEHRLWLRNLLALLCDVTPPAASPAVEFARDLARIAAAERACRILRSDLPSADRAAEAAGAERARAAEG